MYVTIRRIRLQIAVAAFATVTFVAIACGSGAGEPEQPIYNPTPPDINTLLLPAIADPLAVTLVTVQGGGDAPYTIGIPPGWVREISPNGSEQFAIKVSGLTGAFFTVTCGEPETGDPELEYTSHNLALKETRVLDGRPALGETPGIFDSEINGRPAASYTDNRTFGLGVGTTGISVFIATPECAWVFRFVQAISAADASTYPQLFGRIVSSFVPGGSAE